MNWRTRSILNRVLSAAPLLHYVAQRYVTRSVPSRPARTRRRVEVARKHCEAAERCGVSVRGARSFEYGAGWDLLGPLVFSARGVRSQVVADLRPLARPWLVREMADQLRGMGLQPDPGAIDYRAPCDARDTGLPARSFDLVSTVSVLEHVPAADIPALHAESFRLLRPGGLMVHTVDLSDHYSHGTGLPGLHFLQVPDDEWGRHQSAVLYQNRLRYPEHVAMIEAAGFRVVVCEPEPVRDEDRGAPMLDRFARMGEAALVRSLFVVARKPDHVNEL